MNPLLAKVRPVSPGQTLAVILILGFVLRLFFVLLFVDLSTDSYWEYGDIAKNLHAGKGYSLFYFNGEKHIHAFNPLASPLPSAYMAPGYVAVLYPFLTLENVVLRNILILLFHTLVGMCTIYAVYVLTRDFFSRNAGMIAAAITALLPEFVYAIGSFTPTLLYHLGVVLLLYSMYRIRQHRRNRQLLLMALLCVVLVYLRTEFLIFVIVVVLYMLFRVNVRSAFLVAGVTVVLLAPWQVRNYEAFGEWVPFSTSGGLNLFRGHNEVKLGAWGDETTIKQVAEIVSGPKYELDLNRVYFNRALQFISAHPGAEVLNSVKKAGQFWLFNPDEERALTPWYLFPWIILLAAGLAGAIVGGSWRHHSITLLFLVYSTVVVLVFFALPRYQTMMKIAIVPFAALGFEYLFHNVAHRQVRGDGGRV